MTLMTLPRIYPVVRARDAVNPFQRHLRHHPSSGGKILNPINPLTVTRRCSSSLCIRRSSVHPLVSSFCMSAFCVPTYSPVVSAHAFHERNSSALAVKAFTSRWQHSSIQAEIESSACRLDRPRR
jgi:hypothetical protein